MKARIVERTRQDGSKKYVLQKRILWTWFDYEEYCTLKDARRVLCFHDGTRVVDRVLGDESQPEPDPTAAAAVKKLGEIFGERLKREEDPDEFLRGMGPMVRHEFRTWLPTVVNEAQGKLYVLDSPVHGGKSIFVDGDFAHKVLALNGFPN